jgi:AraC-like DNA-binding protein
MRLASVHAVCRELVPLGFWSMPADARVSQDAVHEMLVAGVERLRDEQLGLKLGFTMSMGSGGPFDYAVRSAPTLGESLAVASRYSSLLTDSFRVSFETWRDQALVRLENEAVWPRSASDFAMSALYKLHVAEQVPASQLECWFPYATPRNTGEYQRIFAGASLRFGAPFHGFVFDRARAEIPMPGADKVLHALLRSCADSLLVELSAPPALSAAVRRLIAAEIPSGNPDAERIARALCMSRRTLSRKLEREHTSFNAELDGVRRKLALEYVCDCNIPLSEVAFRAGFSHVESFHRAFRRWTKQTPLTYRVSHARSRC